MDMTYEEKDFWRHVGYGGIAALVTWTIFLLLK